MCAQYARLPGLFGQGAVSSLCCGPHLPLDRTGQPVHLYAPQALVPLRPMLHSGKPCFTLYNKRCGYRRAILISRIPEPLIPIAIGVPFGDFYSVFFT